MIQLPHFLCLRHGGGGLLPVDGNGYKPLIFGLDIRKLHSGHKAQLLFIGHIQQLRDKGIEPEIAHDFFVVHAVGLAHDLHRAFANVPLGHIFQPPALVLDVLHFQIQKGSQFAG